MPTPRARVSLHTHSLHLDINQIILAYFGSAVKDSLDARGEAAFKRQLYFCLLGQGLQRKTWIETWRSENMWALLMWQLNEVWPTGGWGSLGELTVLTGPNVYVLTVPTRPPQSTEPR